MLSKKSFSFKRQVVLLVVVLCLACSFPAISQPASSTPTVTPTLSTPLPAHTTAPVSVDNITVDYTYTKDLVTALYHLYGSVLDNFLDISITNENQDAVRVLVESEVNGYTSKVTDTLIVQPGDTLEIHQNPLLVPEAIDKLASQKPADFHIRIVYLQEGQERIILDETKPILVFSRRDFPWMEGFTSQEMYELWAAWVTPTDPAVEELIRVAADYNPDGIMTNGYAGIANDESGSVWRRLKAIWDAEAKIYQLTYISTMVTFAPGSVQRMRLPVEVLEQKSGNCVELVALYASAVEALSLEPAIIRIPGHAFLAVRMDDQNAQYYVIETTMIGRSSFEDAMDVGKREFNETMPHLEAQEDGYAWVTIPSARQKGILPIPWR